MGDLHTWASQQLQILLGFEGVNEIYDHLIKLDDQELATYVHVCKEI